MKLNFNGKIKKHLYENLAPTECNNPETLFFKKARELIPNRKIMSVKTARRLVSNLSDAQKNNLKVLLDILRSQNFIDESSKLKTKISPHKFFGIFQKVIDKLIQHKKVQLKKTQKIILLGSSLDKIGFLLELRGYDVTYVPFSRSSSIYKKYSYTEDDFYLESLIQISQIDGFSNKELHQIGVNKIKKEENKEYIIIDMSHSARSLFFFSRALQQYLNQPITMVSIPNMDESFLMTFKDDIKIPQTIKFVELPISNKKFYQLSKEYRCIPLVQGKSTVKMTKQQILLCNLIRLGIVISFQEDSSFF